MRICKYNNIDIVFILTLRYPNMATENTLFMRDIPFETQISNGFPTATFDYRRVYVLLIQVWTFATFQLLLPGTTIV